MDVKTTRIADLARIAMAFAAIGFCLMWIGVSNQAAAAEQETDEEIRWCDDWLERARQRGLGVTIALGGIAGNGPIGADATAGFAWRSPDLQVHVALGAATDFMRGTWGFTVVAGLRYRWLASKKVFPLLEARFTNFSQTWRDDPVEYRWLAGGAIGIDWVVMERKHAELVISPTFEIGVNRAEMARHVGAHKEQETDNALHIGGGLAIRLIIW